MGDPPPGKPQPTHRPCLGLSSSFLLRFSLLHVSSYRSRRNIPLIQGDLPATLHAARPTAFENETVMPGEHLDGLPHGGINCQWHSVALKRAGSTTFPVHCPCWPRRGTHHTVYFLFFRNMVCFIMLADFKTSFLRYYILPPEFSAGWSYRFWEYLNPMGSYSPLTYL
jgi:hypothetical protein